MLRATIDNPFTRATHHSGCRHGLILHNRILLFREGLSLSFLVRSELRCAPLVLSTVTNRGEVHTATATSQLLSLYHRLLLKCVQVQNINIVHGTVVAYTTLLDTQLSTSWKEPEYQ